MKISKIKAMDEAVRKLNHNEFPITLTEYVLIKEKLYPKTNSLVRQEFAILKLKHPLTGNWMARHGPMLINRETYDQLKLIQEASCGKKLAKAKARREKAKKDAFLQELEKNTLPKEPKKIAVQPRVVFTPSVPRFEQTNEFLQSYEWRKLRLVALKQQGAKCCVCGASPSTGAVMNVDHIKPRKYHPELALVLSNLQILCSECNHGKGNWDDTDYRNGAIEKRN